MGGLPGFDPGPFQLGFGMALCGIRIPGRIPILGEKHETFFPRMGNLTPMRSWKRGHALGHYVLKTRAVRAVSLTRVENKSKSNQKIFKKYKKNRYPWYYKSQPHGPVYRQLGARASWGKCELGDFNLPDFLGTSFILIHFYLINATNEHYYLTKIHSINNKL